MIKQRNIFYRVVSTLEVLGALWTNPPQNSWQGAEPPFLAMLGFWEHLEPQPLPYLFPSLNMHATNKYVARSCPHF